MMDDMAPVLARIVAALERLSPPEPAPVDWTSCPAFLWDGPRHTAHPVTQVNHVPLAVLHAIDDQAQLLLDNTECFAKALPANNALLWGARGMGKSSLIKAIHADVAQRIAPITLVEVRRDDIATLPILMRQIRTSPARVVLFCDDLSFTQSDAHYMALKAVLDGGIEGCPNNLIVYATSNQRHLIKRVVTDDPLIESVHQHDNLEDTISLSDRFGLWLGFHRCTQEDYMAIINAYVSYFKLPIDQEAAATQAHAWSMTRGGRSGRVAWQFIQHLAGQLNMPLSR